MRREGKPIQQCAACQLLAALPDPEAADVRHIDRLEQWGTRNLRERDELAATLEKIRDGEHDSGCEMKEYGAAPGGRECSCSALQARAALKRIEEAK
jgi:hypothetical protein